MSRRPDMTLRNLAVTPLLLIRVPIMALGLALELLGAALQELGSFVPAWTDYGRRK